MNSNIIAAVITGSIAVKTTLITILMQLNWCKRKKEEQNEYKIIEIEFIDIESEED